MFTFQQYDQYFYFIAVQKRLLCHLATQVTTDSDNIPKFSNRKFSTHFPASTAHHMHTDVCNASLATYKKKGSKFHPPNK